MLGMMNCNDNLEFYACSPASKRLFEAGAEGGDSDGRRRSSKDVLEVFSEVKERVHISYTEDGRKLINGKLDPSEVEKPEKLWNRLILNSFAGRLAKSAHQNGNGGRNSEPNIAASSSSYVQQRQSLDLNAHQSRPSSSNRPSSIKPISPIFVHSANPRFSGEKSRQLPKIEHENEKPSEQFTTKLTITYETNKNSDPNQSD